jgi:agmatine deiminase
MITGKQTNTVYFSDIIRTSPDLHTAYERIKLILDKHNINYKFLSSTKDIWCRDYMPIQVSNDEFIQFRYEPSYLEDDLNLQSDPKVVLKSNHLIAQFSKINLDGGNVVNWNEKAILTTRIFKENPKWNQTDLIKELERLFNAQVLLMPDITTDMTGHSDGHLRFVNTNTILVNELEHEYHYWKKGFLKMIKDSGLNFIEMPWFEHLGGVKEHSAIGCYVNYLEVGNLILFPVFEVAGNKDEEALRIIRSIFPGRSIEPVNVNEITGTVRPI